MLILLFLFFAYLLFVSSMHNLLVFMCVEGFLLFGFVLMLSSWVNWLVGLVFLFFCVCVGAYSVSTLVSSSRTKGSAYLLGVFH